MTRAKEKAASSANTHEDVLRKLASEDDELAILVARNPSSGPELLANIYSQLRTNGYGLTAGCIVLESGRANSELLRRVIEDFPDINEERDVDYPGETSYGVLLAQNQDTPLEVLGQLSLSPYYLVRERLAMRSDLPKNIAARLAKDESRLVRQVLASNVNLPAEELQVLATDTEPAVRFKVAGLDPFPRTQKGSWVQNRAQLGSRPIVTEAGLSTGHACGQGDVPLIGT